MQFPREQYVGIFIIYTWTIGHWIQLHKTHFAKLDPSSCCFSIDVQIHLTILLHIRWTIFTPISTSTKVRLSSEVWRQTQSSEALGKKRSKTNTEFWRTKTNLEYPILLRTQNTYVWRQTNPNPQTNTLHEFYDKLDIIEMWLRHYKNMKKYK
jgi:hypothetical protein